ncbi:MAG: DUF3617 family protein [Bdellovibrionales bacterium]|nr:DUF3617 family protein [Bdellovibrionales bacterium]
MKSFLIVLLFTPSAFATSFNVTPGLWEIHSTVEVDGKKYDPQAEMKKAMANIPEAQKKQMMEMMKSMNKENDVISSLTMNNLCITNEMLKDGSLLKTDKKDKCDFKIKTHTSTKLVGDFKCKDGAKGSVDWTGVNSKSYKGVIDATDARGKRAKINYQSKFINSKCG